MKRALSTAVAVALLLGLGALAVLALPGAQFAGNPARSAPVVLAAAPDAAPASTMFNFVALPLDSSASITPYRASGLATYVGSSVAQVMKWNGALQGFDTFVPGVSPPIPPFDFDLTVGTSNAGGSYFLELGAGPTVLSLVGNVPDQGSVVHSLVKGSSTTDCKFNSISIPLDRDDITTAQALADSVTGVLQVMTWDTTLQGFNAYVPGVSPPIPPFNFEVKIGYPYFICVNSAGPTTWH